MFLNKMEVNVNAKGDQSGNLLKDRKNIEFQDPSLKKQHKPWFLNRKKDHNLKQEL